MTLFENILTRYAKAGEEEEVKPEEVALDFPYHEKLNPALWRSIDEGEYELKPEVKEKLLDIADTFFRTLKTPALEINDIVLTGSNANYNWTEHSDIDLHIIVNVVTGAKKYGKIFPDYITAKRHLWNDRHVVKVHGYAVEVYVQDEREPHSSSGMYSLKNDEWSHVPKHVEPHYDDYAVRTKTAEYMNMINELTDKDGKECNSKRAEEVMEKLKTYRTAGLSTAGEFSVENLVFKVLRNKGYISKLAKCRTQGLDTKLSTEDEEWWNK